jgi:hypothetical protein
MTVKAVLTGDIVNSTRLGLAKDKKLTHALLEIFEGDKMEFYRGDSFQAYVKDPRHALRLALLSRTAAIRLFKDEGRVIADIRISIGIGKVVSPVKVLKTAKGEAFLLSGRQFDNIIKMNRRLAIISNNALANEGLQVIADYLDQIFFTMTGKQAEVVFEMLKGKTQKEVAGKIKRTKSTVHQRTLSGRWPEIESLLQRYENIINQLL